MKMTHNAKTVRERFSEAPLATKLAVLFVATGTISFLTWDLANAETFRWVGQAFMAAGLLAIIWDNWVGPLFTKQGETDE